MKTFSQRFLKGALAILLVVVMLFGSTITGFAATVDKAETKGNHTGGYVYFIKPSTWSNVALIVGHDSWFQTYKMTKLSGNLYYVNLKSAAGGSWDGWNGWGFVDSSTTTNGGTKVWNKYNTYTHYTNLNTSYWLTDGKTEVCTPSSSNNNASFSINRPSSYTGLNFSQTVYSQLSGSSTTNAACGTITLNSYALTGNGTGSSATVTKSTSETSKSRSAANGTTVTLTATAASGYKFVGWFTSATATTATSTSATYTYICDGSAKEFYARFEKAGFSYTAVANPTAGGTVSPEGGTASSVTLTAKPNTGYKFDNWTFTGGTGDTETATTTFTPSANGAKATANFSKITGTVTLDNQGATTPGTTSVDVTYGDAMPKIAVPTKTGHIFNGYFTAPNGGAVKFYNADGTSAKAWDGNNTKLYASWTKNKYTVSVTQEPTGVTGTVKLNNTEKTSDQFEYESTVPVEITAPVGYFIESVNDENLAAGTKTYTTNVTVPANDYEIAVTYVEDTAHIISFTDETKSLKIGATYKNVLTKNKYCTDAITYVSSAPNEVSVASDGTVTVNGYVADTVVITATCATGATDFYEITVLEPKISFENFTLKVNATGNASNTGWNLPTNFEIKHTSASDIISVTEDGVVTAYAPGTAEVVVEAYYNDAVIASDTYTVTVSKPTVTATPSKLTFYVGHEASTALTFDDVKYDTAKGIKWTVNNTGIATATAAADGKSATITAVAIGETKAKASIVYNEKYTMDVEVAVSVVKPTITVSPTSVNLEFGTGSTKNTGSFTVKTDDVSGSCELDDTITAISDDSTVATASYSNGKVTVTANSVGSTNITVSFHGETKKVPVNVKKYDSDVLIYLYANKSTYTSWTDDVRIHLFNTADSSEFSLIHMPRIGVSKDGTSYVFAIKVPRYEFIKSDGTSATVSVMFTANGSWTEQTNEYKFSVSSTDTYKAFTLQGTPSKNMTLLTGSTFNITMPSVSVSTSSITVPVGSTYDLTAEHTGGTINWGVADTSYATVKANGTSATVTGVKKGHTTLSVCSFASTTNSSLSSLNTADINAWPYIGATEIVNVNVVRALDDQKCTVFLSDGRYLNYNADTTILTEGVTGTSKSIGHLDDREDYKVINLNEFKTLEWETTINHADKKYIEINSYIVYKLETETWEIVKPQGYTDPDDKDAVKYRGSVVVNGDCYIVPVFFYNDQYCEDNGYVNIELYFDASAIQNLRWGPFVSAYAWGGANNADDYFGDWPGQLMIPSEDGKSFYTQLTVPEAGSANPAAGVTFNNYMWATCPVQESSAFGYDTTNIQTYDYREAITLYEAGYDVITFVAKTSKDGYHGEEGVGVKVNTIHSTTTPEQLFSNYEFDYLYCRDGKKAMDFTGNPVEDTAPKKDIDKADYYVVTKGDRDINPGGYSGDTSYNGHWSVEWYIFDSTGKFIKPVLSTALWHDLDTTDDIHQTVLMTELGLTPETAAGKTVAISYELANHADGNAHKLAYDGQWYGNMLDDTVNGQVIVGLDMGNSVEEQNFVFETDETLNIGELDANAFFGKGYVKDLSGDLHQSLDIKIDYGIIDLSANVGDGYIFVGWFTKRADGTYKEIANATTYSTYINMDETYYAVFRKLGDAEVVINHERYSCNDPAIISHDGIGEMSIEVKDSNGKVVATGPISTAATKAAFTATEGETYTVRIITTPLMRGKFFAWYTDSKKADGTDTYEEILTESYHRDSTAKVEATFEYKYDSTDESLDKNITIYSDIRPVTNTTKIVYSYFNRFGEPRYYTIKDIPLSYEECTGKNDDGTTYAGNDGKEYVLTYRTLVTFILPDGETEWSNYFPEETVADRIAEYENKGYTFVSSFNKIQFFAPDADVTEAFNDQISWVITDEHITPEEAIIKVKAEQEPPTFTVNYSMPGEDGNIVSDSASGPYNTLMTITAPATDKDGNTFSYWYEPATGEILCYTRYYNYMIVENKTIKAVYGETVTQDWTPSINSVTYTREYSDAGDFVYTDYLLAFNNKDGKILSEVYQDENIKYGLLVLRDANYYIDEKNKNNIEYPDVTNPDIANYLKRTAKEKEKNMAFTVDGTKYNCYFYGLTGNKTTVFNRCDYFVRYYNDYVVYTDETDPNNKKPYYYRDYALTAVAYIIVDGEVYLSQPKNVNFYELGNMPVTSVN